MKDFYHLVSKDTVNVQTIKQLQKDDKRNSWIGILIRLTVSICTQKYLDARIQNIYTRGLEVTQSLLL